MIDTKVGLLFGLFFICLCVHLTIRLYHCHKRCERRGVTVGKRNGISCLRLASGGQASRSLQSKETRKLQIITYLFIYISYKAYVSNICIYKLQVVNLQQVIYESLASSHCFGFSSDTGKTQHLWPVTLLSMLERS